MISGAIIVEAAIDMQLLCNKRFIWTTKIQARLLLLGSIIVILKFLNIFSCKVLKTSRKWATPKWGGNFFQPLMTSTSSSNSSPSAKM